MLELDWAQIIISILIATSGGTRFVNWVRASRARMMVCQVLANVLEYLGNSATLGADEVKREAKKSLTDMPHWVQLQSEEVAAIAERAMGTKDGSAAKSVKKRKSIGRELMKWLPIIGAFLP